MIQVKNLTKRYGNHTAFSDISFTVNEGEILGFLGPNGAGKTTTMNIITGCLAATEGTVIVDGYDVVEEPIKAKSCIGYLPEEPPLYREMQVIEFLNFMCDLRKVKDNKEEHINEIMEDVWISDVRYKPIKTLSKGYRQRVGFAAAMIGNPKVLILDEPTVGLDPNQIIEIRNLILELGKNHTIILSTHILNEVSKLCDRAVIIGNGTIVADIALDETTDDVYLESVFAGLVGAKLEGDGVEENAGGEADESEGGSDFEKNNGVPSAENLDGLAELTEEEGTTEDKEQTELPIEIQEELNNDGNI